MSEMHRIRVALSDVYMPAGVETWLSSPNRLFDGEKPMCLVREGRGAEVLAVAEMLADGNF